MTNSPLVSVLSKIGSGQSVNMQMCGDSTVSGTGDKTTLQGICGRLGIRVGEVFNTTVQINKYTYKPSTGGSYGGFQTLRTGTGSNSVNVYNGGVAGSRIIDQATFITNGLIPATPDILFLATAFNDTGSTASAFVSDIRTFINSIRASYPNTPIVITTENVAGGTYYTAKETATRVLLSALAGSLLGTTITLPLSTTFAESTTDANVWILDTKQAFNYTLTASESHDGLHPNSVGYTVEADWIFASLTSSAGTSPTITTNAIGTIIQGVPFSQTLTATGTGTLTWALSTGSLPDGLTISASGILAGTPRAFGEYDFTLSVTNTVGTDIVRYTGTITNPSPSSPFASNTTTRYRYRLIGQYYPVVAKVKVSGTFKKSQGFN